ncbi:hypothetical protein [Paenibacillus humicola]|uniref:hypothetical protein n=1 Tax=Paenibacillus humicola TaxID=3110540 RepID=UPI00237B7CBD|nr:hypothetical protein [Paenibacillus humicola]
MLITLAVLLLGIPLFLLLAPEKKRKSALADVWNDTAETKAAALASAAPPEPGTQAFELPMRSGAKRNG